MAYTEETAVAAVQGNYPGARKIRAILCSDGSFDVSFTLKRSGVQKAFRARLVAGMRVEAQEVPNTLTFS